MPPPTNQQCAVAGMQYALDHNFANPGFHHMQPHPQPPIAPQYQAHPAPAVPQVPNPHVVDVCVPGPTHDGAPALISMDINVDTIDPQDFLAQTIEPAKIETPKRLETTCSEEICELKEALRCANPKHHCGRETCCFVHQDDGHVGEHIQMPYKAVSLWVRMKHDKVPGVDNNNPPECLKLDNLAESNVKSALLEELEPQLDLIFKSTSVVWLVLNEDEDDKTAAILICTVLEELNCCFPDLEYIQYKQKLRQQGIAYVHAIQYFNKKFFNEKVSMTPGSIDDFILAGKRYMKGKGKKRLRVENYDSDKENQCPS
ncbi:hypothetical protein BT96DRAFT_1009539 [Gymnopus androsaceus JB14]|uniref:Uncharacterized protein n=1 Tax=Gymnopus androsaceus JB14 TaxID=1447944 RepID=A0A6A4GCN9_9AGAR|nr:hypothetical protein BT96DRAFT_1009539 [Gymnopus androsaceus JB14]